MNIKDLTYIKMDTKHVFCLITAAKCPHCNTFRKDWDDVRRAIEATGLVRIVDIELNSTSDVPSSDKYPRDLARYVKWFPTFLLFNGKSWNAAFPGLSSFEGERSDAKLEGVVFNGILENGIPKYVHLKAPTKENLLNWIQQEVKNGTLSGQPQSPILSLLSNTPSGNASTKSGHKFVALGSSRASPQTNTPGGSGSFFVPTAASSVCKMRYRPKNHGF